MKELLYIPNSEYIEFHSLIFFRKGNRDNLQKYLDYWGSATSPERAINNILNGWFSEEFHKYNNLPEFTQLTREQFEIIEVEK
jgi:hypothetical protein